MLLCRIATIHGTCRTALGITVLVLIVTFRCFAMVFGRFFMIGGSLFMEAAGFLDIRQDVVSYFENADWWKFNVHDIKMV